MSEPAKLYDDADRLLCDVVRAAEAAQEAVYKLSNGSSCYHAGGGVHFLCLVCEKEYLTIKPQLTAATAALEGLGAKMIDGVWRMPCPQCVRACDPANGYGPSVCNEHCARSCHGTGWLPVIPPSQGPTHQPDLSYCCCNDCYVKRLASEPAARCSAGKHTCECGFHIEHCVAEPAAAMPEAIRQLIRHIINMCEARNCMQNDPCFDCAEVIDPVEALYARPAEGGSGDKP